MVLPPDGRRQQDVLGGDRRAPRHVVLADVQPLRVLVEHRVDDVRERLVGVEEAVPAGEQVALEPPEQRVLRQHLHDPAIGRELAAVGVLRKHVGHPRLLARLVDGLQPVGGRLVGPDAEARHVQLHDVAQELAERPRVFALHGAARRDVNRILAEVRQLQVLAQEAAVGVRVGAHAAGAARRELLQLQSRRPFWSNSSSRPIAAHPVLEQFEVGGVLPHVRERHLVRARTPPPCAP